MSTLEVFLTTVLLLGIGGLVFGYVLSPLRNGPHGSGPDPSSALRLAYERTLIRLRELEADWRTGKLPEEDYLALRQRYLEEGATLLRVLREGSEGASAEDWVEAALRARQAHQGGKGG